MPSIINHALPRALRENTVIKHLDDPYSDAAIAEPYKNVIDLGYVDTSRLPIVGSGGVKEWNAKPQGLAIPALAPCYQPISARLLRNLAIILSSESFHQINVNFTHRSGEVQAGDSLTGGRDVPHLDGFFREDNPFLYEQRLLAVVCFGLSTLGWQGPATRADFWGHQLTEEAMEDDRFYTEPVPVGRMCLMGMAHPHQEPTAEEYIPLRHFLRFTVNIT